MAIRHIGKHIIQSVHQRLSERKGQQAIATPILLGLEENSQWKKVRAPIFASTHTNPTVSPNNSNNLYMDSDMPDVDMEVPLSELLNYIAGDRTPEPEFNGAHLDLFAELQASLNCGEIPFSTPLAPVNDEYELFDDSAPDFGIEVPDDGNYNTTGTNAIASRDSPTYPWTSKANFITSLLFSSPSHPFSDGQKKAILNWAKELGARDVPSFGAVKKVQKHINRLVGDPTEKVTARSGDIFYINNVAESIARDYVNPLTRFTMQDHPEDGGDGMSQVFNSTKMLLDLPSPPAVRVDGTIYFVNELLQESSKAYFIPEHFFLGLCPPTDEVEPGAQSNAKIQYALGRAVQWTDAGFIILLQLPGELECGLTASSAKFASLTPNLLRKKSNGRMWNKHHAIYMSNANLLREMLKKEFFVRFVTSSPHAAPMELMRAMKESICVAAESGIVAWDCKDSEEVMLIPYGLFIAGDNPMQAEECSHAGLNCNYYCRSCDVGGMKEYKESETGYTSIFNSGNIQTPEETANKNSMSSTGIRDMASASVLNTLLELGKKLRKHTAGSPALPENEVRIALEKEFKQLLQGGKLDDAINPLLGMHAFNVHMDTPTEILHMVLLGVVKYFWGQTTVNKDVLNAPCLNTNYICHYKGSLIGKHFKSLAQVMPFLIYDLVPPMVLNGWTVMGELVVLVWHTKITNTEVYLAKLTRTIQDFLNVMAQCAPSILISKPKFHFLVHLPAYIRCFGPAIIFSMERYKSFNHVFRLSCIYSNRQAPSRDTCKLFAHQDIIKHVATGGYWYDSKIKKWVCTGVQVLSYLNEHPGQAWLLGLSNFGRSAPIPGSGKVETMYIGCIQEILISSDDHQTVEHVALQCFAFTETLHPSLHLPCLDLTDDEVVFSAADIVCSINIQHNCIDSHCTDTAQQPVYQEWTLTSRSRPIVQHKPTPYYFLNAYSIHNYDYIHLITPDTLRETPLRVTNVAKVRALAVQQMREKRAAKKSGDVPQQGEGGHIDDIPTPRAVFDRAPTTTKTSAKAKAKVSSSSTQGRKKTAPSCTSQAVAGPSGPATPLPRNALDVAALDQ
ncbi:hypothetical protein F4604DRAFT_1923063 [Suillus subluteus]|nr:hypothetical protein F4604DRAFT_1923063 [Suillus subluteus]